MLSELGHICEYEGLLLTWLRWDHRHKPGLSLQTGTYHHPRDIAKPWVGLTFFRFQEFPAGSLLSLKHCFLASPLPLDKGIQVKRKQGTFKRRKVKEGDAEVFQISFQARLNEWKLLVSRKISELFFTSILVTNFSSLLAEV